MEFWKKHYLIKSLLVLEKICFNFKSQDAAKDLYNLKRQDAANDCFNLKFQEQVYIVPVFH